LIISLLQICVGLVSPLAGRALDSFPVRYLVSAGALLLALGLFLASLAQTLWHLIAIYALLFPLTLTLSGTLTSQALVTRWFQDKRGMAIGISSMGTNLGGIVFPLLVAAWLASDGWRSTMFQLAVLSLLLIVPLGWLVLGRNPGASHNPGTVASGGVPAPAWTTKAILTSSLFWIPVIGILPLNTAFGAVQFNLAAYATDIGLTRDQAGGLIALSSFTMILGKLFFGSLGDRLDHRYLYWMAAGCMSAAMLILQSQPALWLLIAGVLLVGLAGGGILPLLGVVFSARFGVAAFGRVMGLVMLVITFGAVGPMLAGWVYDLTGSYDGAFLAFIGLFVPGVVLMRRLPAPAALG
jgi:MFS family permease